MKKILYGLLTSSLVVGAIALGSTAFFSDQVTSLNNTFTAGTIDLRVWSWYDTENNGDFGSAEAPVELTSPNALFILSDLKPGDSGEVNFRARVTTNPAFLCGYVGLQEESDENLADMIDVYLSAATGSTGVTKLGDASYVDQWYDLTNGIEFPAGIDGDFKLHYCFGDFDATKQVCDPNPIVDYDVAQGKVVSAVMSMYAEQARNNDDFTCEGLNSPLPSPTPAPTP